MYVRWFYSGITGESSFLPARSYITRAAARSAVATITAACAGQGAVPVLDARTRVERGEGVACGRRVAARGHLKRARRGGAASLGVVSVRGGLLGLASAVGCGLLRRRCVGAGAVRGDGWRAGPWSGGASSGGLAGTGTRGRHCGGSAAAIGVALEIGHGTRGALAGLSGHHTGVLSWVVSG
jgi:hypothetical protein